MPPEQCLPCSKEREIAEIHATVTTMCPLVKEMHRKLFVGNDGDSLMTKVALHDAAIKSLKSGRKTFRGRTWEFAKLLLAVGLALLGRWLMTR